MSLGTVALLVVLVGALPGAASASPRTLTGGRAELDNAAAPASQIDRTRDRRSLGVRIRRYRQVIGGLPVLSSETVVTDAPGRRGDLLLDGTRRLRRPAGATVSRARAVRVALQRTRATRRRGPERASLAILPRAGGARTVWKVFVLSSRPVTTYEVLVDARTARVLRVRNRLKLAANDASIFNTNPVVENNGRGSLTDSSLDSAFAGLTTAVTLQRGTVANCLTGSYADVDIPPLETAACNAGRDFSSFARSSDKFDAANAYFHIDRAQNYIQTQLGITTANNRSIPVHVNADTDDNSFYNSVTKDITLGSGGVDDAEDGEVVTHEYGHSVQDDQVPDFGATDEGGAMGEGFGDYLSAALAKTFAPNPTFDACAFEWDEVGFGDTSQVPCFRRVDGNLTAEQVGPGTSCNGEVHCAGEAWSGALWAIRAQIDGVATDRLVIQSHFSLTPDSGFAEGAQALISSDQSLYGGAHAAFLRNLLTQRGFITDNLPSGATELAIPSSRAGTLSSSTDVDDVYGVSLVSGRGYVFRLRGTAGDFDLRLLRPGSTSLAASNVVGAAETGGSNEDLPYTAPVGGRFFLDVHAFSGAGAYTVTALPDTDRDRRPDAEDNCVTKANPGQENSDGDALGDVCDRFPDDARNDQDGDGRGADDDNCPTTKNPRQADWDADDHGDVCDRSSKVSLKRLKLRGGTLTLRATLRPGLLGKKAVTIRIERRSCSKCRFKKLATVRRERNRGKGRVDVAARVRGGKNFRARAFLKDKRYRSVSSRSVKLSRR